MNWNEEKERSLRWKNELLSHRVRSQNKQKEGTESALARSKAILTRIETGGKQ